jgi:predicted DNA-binding transcriptional regulator AlpA
MSSDRQPNGLLRLNEVAAAFGVSPRTIQRWVKVRRFPQPFRPAGVTGKPFWKKSDIDLFVTAGGIHGYRREKRRT